MIILGTKHQLCYRIGHCKSMKPAWDELGELYAASSSVLIGDVDCTAEGESLCEGRWFLPFLGQFIVLLYVHAHRSPNWSTVMNV